MSHDFYIWESVSTERSVLITSEPKELIEFGVDRFTYGNKIFDPVPRFKFQLDPENQKLDLLDDVPIVGVRMFIVSQKLSHLLISFGIDCIDFYPCIIYNPMTNQIREDYFITNILDCIFCLDWNRSKLTVSEYDPSDIDSIDEMKLIQSRIEGELLFRLGEDPSIILVHESLKEEIERSDIRGVEFIPADGYVETGLNWDTNLMGTHISTIQSF